MFLRATAFRQYLQIDRGRPHSEDTIEKVKYTTNDVSRNLSNQQLNMYDLIYCFKFLRFEYFGCLLQNKPAKSIIILIISNDLIIKELLPCDDYLPYVNRIHLYKKFIFFYLLFCMLVFVIDVIILYTLVGAPL